MIHTDLGDQLSEEFTKFCAGAERVRERIRDEARQKGDLAKSIIGGVLNLFAPGLGGILNDYVDVLLPQEASDIAYAAALAVVDRTEDIVKKVNGWAASECRGLIAAEFADPRVGFVSALTSPFEGSLEVVRNVVREFGELAYWIDTPNGREMAILDGAGAIQHYELNPADRYRQYRFVSWVRPEFRDTASARMRAVCECNIPVVDSSIIQGLPVAPDWATYSLGIDFGSLQ